MLCEGRDRDDPLFLQVKEATASVLEAHLGPSTYANHAERVVEGQRLMQTTSDIFLSFLRAGGGRDYYVRQLRDWKGGIDLAKVIPDGLEQYAGICGWTLARAHARTGDAVAIAAYLGKADTFDRAIVRFADSYSAQNLKDHAALVAAVASGRLEAVAGK